MNITEKLSELTDPTTENQKEFLNEVKEIKIFDLSETDKLALIDFLCEKADQDLAIDYLYHVLDNEISYPIDDEKVKSLFSDERMQKLKDVMLSQLNDEEEGTEVEVESEDETTEA
jgi:hypothetical protein